jgi:hypothetical protein
MPVQTTAAPTTPYCVQCHTCKRWIDSLFYPVFSDPQGNSHCETCNHWFTCADCGELTDKENTSDCACERDLCNDCYCERFTRCAGCGEECYREDCREVAGQDYCEDCARNAGNWEPTGWANHSGCTARIGSARKFGVEIETASCNDHIDLHNDGAWGAKEDCSVSGKEFASDILDGDEGLEEIERLCQFARNNDWEVDDSCGLHIHLDARNESSDSLKAAACAYLATYDVWSQFVDSDRLDNHYCGASNMDCDTAASYSDFNDFAYASHRYDWINFSAYRRHSTFEVRLHHGSLNAKEICNWVRGHTTFMDWAVKQPVSGIVGRFAKLSTTAKFRKMCAIWTAAGCADLCDYFESKGEFAPAEFADSTVSSYTASRIRELQVVAAGRGIQ